VDGAYHKISAGSLKEHKSKGRSAAKGFRASTLQEKFPKTSAGEVGQTVEAAKQKYMNPCVKLLENSKQQREAVRISKAFLSDLESVVESSPVFRQRDDSGDVGSPSS